MCLCSGLYQAHPKSRSRTQASSWDQRNLDVDANMDQAPMGFPVVLSCSVFLHSCPVSHDWLHASYCSCRMGSQNTPRCCTCFTISQYVPSSWPFHCHPFLLVDHPLTELTPSRIVADMMMVGVAASTAGCSRSRGTKAAVGSEEE